jgi:HSP20 family protein
MAKETTSVPTVRSIFSEFEPFQDFFRPPVWTSRYLPFAWGEQHGIASWAPAMDITESKSGYTVTLELAGAKKDDISIECHDKLLTVKGEKQSEREVDEEHRHYKERSFGSFSRSIRLPSNASDEIHAKFSDGVLTIDIPKVEEAKPRAVAIDT